MSGQLGLKTEVTVGTAVTPDIFIPVDSSNLAVAEGWMRPSGIRAGRRTRNPAVLGARDISGSVAFEMAHVSIATVLKHAFGTVVTTGAGPYTHTFTPGSLSGDAFTLQTGISDATDTIRPFTAAGCKMSSWNLSCNVGEFAKFSFDWTAKDIVTATALATASYASGLVPFTFIEGAITVNGSATPVRSVQVACNLGLKTDRHVLGSRLIREQLEQDRRDFSTSITADFEDLTLYALSVAGTQVASVLTFTSGADTLTVTSSGQVTSAVPSLTTVGLEENTVTYEQSHATADASAITAVLVNTESSAA